MVINYAGAFSSLLKVQWLHTRSTLKHEKVIVVKSGYQISHQVYPPREETLL